MNVYAKFCCVSLRIEKALRMFRELITTTTTKTTRVAFWDPPSGSKNKVTCYMLSDLIGFDDAFSLVVPPFLLQL